MSGIEVAGLVLGALPLIIQGIDSYREGLSTLRSMWDRDIEYPALLRKLRAQYDHYELTIRILFGSITSEAEWTKMTTDPMASRGLWKSKETALQDKLQNAYNSYQSIMAEIEQITKSIASRLDLDGAAELTRNNLDTLLAANPKKSNDKFEFRKRVRFGMSKKKLSALLEKLDECNRQLERFTEKSEKIETYHRPSKPSYATRLQKLQRYAKILHDALCVCWSCSCKSSHTASLQLDPRGDIFAPRFREALRNNKTSFNISFSTISPDSSGVSWTFQAARICVDEEDDACLSPMASPKPNRMQRNVSFGSLPPYAVQDPATTSPPSYEEVKDLCASIQQLYKKSPTIGFSLDSKSKLRGAYSVDTAEAQIPSTELISLETLLERPPVINGKRSKLSRKERYSLALTLASSILYLNSTPWLANEWAARDILFHRTSDTTCPIDLDRAYLAPNAADRSENGSKGHNQMFLKNNFLLALAVALLELYFGTTAEKYHQSEFENETGDGSADQKYNLLTLVHNWIQNEAGELSAAYQSAVSYCMKESVDPTVNLQDTNCLQAAVENIVLPLQEELNQFLGKTLA
ncbi:hypothetical protein CC77DRAFT_141742 [Alternaria alternata]|uniref:DUF7580 domain-containing protein n=1 Tax=Alternaria alternata TaxID=5599 RepID=A0A177DJ66_ALTAL|nr:hypothetical protein CC77DRAFT_141742 [Alternaria alternata]OAG19813.1 hypothetical protein CC77DRAFT_141742 [Alternaria alternata]RYN79089.1 hypothetical protein AA0117_g3969 [Alternaria alternata]